MSNSNNKIFNSVGGNIAPTIEILSDESVIIYLRKFANYLQRYIPVAGTSKATLASGLSADAMAAMYDFYFMRKSATWAEEDTKFAAARDEEENRTEFLTATTAADYMREEPTLYYWSYREGRP